MLLLVESKEIEKQLTNLILSVTDVTAEKSTDATHGRRFLITAGQLRAARAMLRLDQRQFATLVHISIGAVQRLERSRGPLDASPEFLRAIRIALDDAGIELIDSGSYSGQGGPGVRLKGDVMVQAIEEPSLGEAAEARLAVVA